MGDTIIIVIVLCITTLGLTAMVLLGTYLKDRITFKSKTSIKDVVENEVAITSEDKNSKK